MTVIRIHLSYSKPECLSIFEDGLLSHACKAMGKQTVCR